MIKNVLIALGDKEICLHLSQRLKDQVNPNKLDCAFSFKDLEDALLRESYDLLIIDFYLTDMMDYDELIFLFDRSNFKGAYFIYFIKLSHLFSTLVIEQGAHGVIREEDTDDYVKQLLDFVSKGRGDISLYLSKMWTNLLKEKKSKSPVGELSSQEVALSRAIINEEFFKLEGDSNHPVVEICTEERKRLFDKLNISRTIELKRLCEFYAYEHFSS